MTSFLLSNPTLSSSPFLSQKLTKDEQNTKHLTKLCSPILRSCKTRTLTSVKCAVDAPYEGNIPKFPRMNVWDPYKCLGISPYASEEEIWSSRNFLLEQYAGHERSVESIEAAFEKLLMTSFRERKKTKINLKTKLKKKVDESPSWVKNLLNFVELPPVEIIFRRLFLFAFMGGWSIMNSAEGGPAFQVAVSLAACIYFLNEKTKNLGRAFVIGLGSLAAGWICGSVFVPMIPTVMIHPTWTLELLTSLKRPGLLSQSLSRVQISTMAVKENLIVSGGFQGEVICKYLNQPGVTFCTKVTTDENAITNSVDIYHNNDGSMRIMTTNNDALIRVFDVESFACLNRFSFDWSVNNTSVSPYGKMVAVLGAHILWLLSGYSDTVF